MHVYPLVQLYRYKAKLIHVYYVQIALLVIGILFGALLIWKPKKVIEIQRTIYGPFNWKMEPISMKKAIRNTRIMGVVIFILGSVAFIYMISIMKEF